MPRSRVSQQNNAWLWKGQCYWYHLAVVLMLRLTGVDALLWKIIFSFILLDCCTFCSTVLFFFWVRLAWLAERRSARRRAWICSVVGSEAFICSHLTMSRPGGLTVFPNCARNVPTTTSKLIAWFFFFCILFPNFYNNFTSSSMWMLLQTASSTRACCSARSKIDLCRLSVTFNFEAVFTSFKVFSCLFCWLAFWIKC